MEFLYNDLLYSKGVKGGSPCPMSFGNAAITNIGLLLLFWFLKSSKLMSNIQKGDSFNGSKKSNYINA